MILCTKDNQVKKKWNKKWKWDNTVFVWSWLLTWLYDEKEQN